MSVAGRLAAIMELDAGGFVRGAKQAEAQAVALARGIVNPLNQANASLSAIGKVAVAPMRELLGSVSRFASFIPGLGALGDVIAHPIQSAKKAMEELDHLGKQSRRVGLDPQFYKALSIAAEDEAGAIGPVMAKLLRFQGQLKQSDTELLTAGGSSADKVVKTWGFDRAAIEGARTGEELLLTFMQQLGRIKDPALQSAAAVAVLGKSAMAFRNTLRNPQEIEEWFQRIQKSAVATKANIGMAQAFDDLQKEIGVDEQGLREAAIPVGGYIGMGWDKITNRKGFWSGVHDIFLGAGNFGAGLFGLEPSHSPEVRERMKRLREQSDQKPDFAEEARLEHQRQLSESAEDLRQKYLDIAAAVGKTTEELQMQKLVSEGLSADMHQRVVAAKLDADTAVAKGDMFKMGDALRDQIELWGMTAEEVRIYKAELAGVPGWITEMNREMLQLRDVKKMAAEFASPAKQIDEMGANVSKARKFWGLGEIGTEDLDSVEIGQLGKFRDLERSLGFGGAGRMAPLMEGFSAATVSTINANALRTDSPRDMPGRVEAVRKEMERRRNEARDQARELGDALAALQLPPVADF